MKTSTMSIVRRCLRPGSVWLTALLLLMAMVCASMGVAHAAETITYYYTSPQGTVLAKADASGNILSNADYRPYGTQALGTPEQGPGYTGHVNDVDSGLVYMQARYYDPNVGRFLSADPLKALRRSPGHTTRYGYANDNPYRFIDPDGRSTIAIGGTFNASAHVGGTVTAQLTLSFPTWSPSTWRIGGYGSVGGLSTTEVAVGSGVAFSYSEADSAEEMASASSNVSAGGAMNAFGGSIGYEQSLCTDCTVVRTLTFGTKITTAPVEIHTSVSQSTGATWIGSKPISPTVTVGQPTTAPPPPPPKPDNLN